jgi:hypothetical protein
MPITRPDVVGRAQFQLARLASSHIADLTAAGQDVVRSQYRRGSLRPASRCISERPKSTPSRPRPDRQAAGLLALVRMDVLIWEFVLDTALGLRDFLAGEGFAPSVTTSGGKGLHVRTAR